MNRRSMAIGIAAAAVATIVLHHETAQAKVPRTAAITQDVDGKAVYLKSCKECHGVLGAPTKASLRKYEKIPDFTDATRLSKRERVVT